MNRNEKYSPFTARAALAAVAVLAAVAFYGVSKSGSISTSASGGDTPSHSLTNNAASSASGIVMSHTGKKKNAMKCVCDGC